MTVTERVAYLKGLTEGLDLDTSSKEGKLLSAIIDVLDDVAFEVSDLQEVVGELGEQIDMIDEDLDGLEEIVYDEDDDDDDCDCCDGDLYEIVCPSCGDSIYLDEDMVEEGEMECPNCGEHLEFDFDEEDEETNDEDDQEQLLILFQKVFKKVASHLTGKPPFTVGYKSNYWAYGGSYIMAKIKEKLMYCLDLLFPPRCFVCGEVIPIRTALCPECMQNLPEKLMEADCCSTCGKPIGSCVCNGRSFYFSHCISAFIYDKNTHQLFEVLKKQPNSYAAEQLSILMANAFLASTLAKESAFDAITEVPMSDSNLQKRGHNQAKALAELLAAKINIDYIQSPLLQTENRKTQHTLSLSERIENAQNSYKKRDMATVSGRILLVDDVMTTGSTLNRCAQLLLQCGAKEVCCITAATTPRWKHVSENTFKQCEFYIGEQKPCYSIRYTNMNTLYQAVAILTN